MNVNRQYKTRNERELIKPEPRPAPAATLAGLSRGILQGLQGKPVYQGTAKDAAFGRRVKNRAASASRRINRRRSA